ncbi:MAG: GumC family protein [Terriglobales bacterium]
MTVEPIRKTALINVSYESSDPELTAKVLRSLAEAYLERHNQVHRASGEFGFFDQQVTQSRHSLEAAELQLAEFTRDQGVVSASQERDMTLQKLSDADADDRRTRVAQAETSERIRALQVSLNTLPERATTQVRNSDNPELMEKMKARLLELELQRTDLLIEFEPSYRLVREVEQKIAQTKAAIAGEDRAPLRDQTSDLEPNHAWAKSELLKAEVESRALSAHASAEAALVTHYRDAAQQLGDQSIAQERLVHDLKASEERYLLYVSKREEARIGDALDQGGILNVAIAEQPVVPELPNLSEMSLALIGLALAGAVSVSVAFATDYLCPAFRTPDEVVAYLRAPVLASLPQRKKAEGPEFPRGLL